MSFNYTKLNNLPDIFHFAKNPFVIYLILLDLMHLGETAENSLCRKQSKAHINEQSTHSSLNLSP